MGASVSTRTILLTGAEIAGSTTNPARRLIGSEPRKKRSQNFGRPGLSPLPPCARGGDCSRAVGARLTCVFDSELDGEIVGAVANHANGVVDETIFNLLSLVSEKAIRGEEHHLQGQAGARAEGRGKKQGHKQSTRRKHIPSGGIKL